MDKYRWARYYKDRVNSESYLHHCSKKYSDFIKEITKDSINSEISISEEGCGIGTFSKILSRLGYNNLHLSDINKPIIILATMNMKKESYKTISIKDCMINDSKSDIIFAHGVIEHFSNKNIHKTLESQKCRAAKIVHYVPTDAYNNPSFGDERLMPVAWWIDNFKPSNWIISNEGKDLTLIWE